MPSDRPPASVRRVEAWLADPLLPTPGRLDLASYRAWRALIDGAPIGELQRVALALSHDVIVKG